MCMNKDERRRWGVEGGRRGAKRSEEERKRSERRVKKGKGGDTNIGEGFRTIREGNKGEKGRRHGKCDMESATVYKLVQGNRV